MEKRRSLVQNINNTTNEVREVIQNGKKKIRADLRQHKTTLGEKNSLNNFGEM